MRSPTAKVHVVQQGDCLESIAFQYGLFPDTIWNAADNAELRARRGVAQVLLPGDELVIPELRAREVSLPVGARYVFKRRGVPARLKVRLVDEDGAPRANLPFTLDVDGKVEKGDTDSDGVVERAIRPDARRAVLTLHGPDGEDEILELQLGHLDPVTSPSGVIARLVNLGLLDGEDADATTLDDAAVRTALQCFQEQRGLPRTGFADDDTRDALQAAHGS